MSLDFPALNARLLSQCPDLLSLWLPGGRKSGHEYVCANLAGGRGESMSVNIQTGAWADFASDAKGGDLISLYAAINGLTQSAAFKELGGSPAALAPAPVTPPRTVLGPPPPGAYPDTSGTEAVYEYRDGNGILLFLILRYPGKVIRPCSWDIHQQRWVNKGWPTPRPLYGLDQLASRPDAAVLIVEGEKACDAVTSIPHCAGYVPITWPNGAAACNSADWSPLRGRKVLIWPDADEAGLKARDTLLTILAPLASEIKYLNTEGLPEKFDAADWAPSPEHPDWLSWARPRVVSCPTVTATAPAAGTPTITIVEDHAPLPASIAVIAETYGLAVKGRSGVPVSNLENLARALMVIPGFSNLVWWDEFYESVRTCLPRNWVGLDQKAPREALIASANADRDWTDADTLALTMRLQRYIGFQSLGTDTATQAIMLVAHSYPRCAPRDWMASLTWDGTPRLDGWLTQAVSAEANPYTRAVGTNFLLSIVARTFKPGCQVDTMMVLEGLQGAGKSSFFNILAGENWYAEASESPTSKDFFMVLRGKLIVEVAELDAFSRTDVTRIKQILSCRTDRYREPYGRMTSDHPRRSVFVGTTNETQYLRDATGARRFWPLEAHRINLDWIRAHRDQLFAEAVHRFHSGENWWLVPAEDAATETEARRVHDEWETKVSEYLTGRAECTLTDVWCDGLSKSHNDMDRSSQYRLSHIMRALRWINKVERRGDKAVRIWRPADPPF